MATDFTHAILYLGPGGEIEPYVTFEALDDNDDVGAAATQVAAGDHTHV